MFFFAFIIVSVSYLLYRYRSVTNKKFFFRSPVFMGGAGSIALLLFAVVLVNVFSPDIELQTQSQITSEGGGRARRLIDSTVAAAKSDTSRHFLLSHSPNYHYHLITCIRREINTSYFLGLEASYDRLSASPVDSISSLGNFGLGMLAWVDKRYDEARVFFQLVKNRRLPCLHFSIAGTFHNQGKIDEAVAEYLQELDVKSEMQKISARQLISIYVDAKNYEALYQLYQYDFVKPLFENQLARFTLLHALDFPAYVVPVFQSVLNKIHWMGFVAALFISIVWLIYIFRLNVYSRSKLPLFLSLFLGGALCSFLVLTSYDAVELLTEWKIKDEIINDLFYCIFVIGIPEEFVKILPLLLVLLVIRKFKEPIDYVIYASASALGFAFIENLIYFKEISSGIIHGRAYFSVIGHMIFSSFVAYGFVMALFKMKRKRSLVYLVPGYFMLAAILHGIYDFLLFEHWIIIFFIYFIFIVQLWIIIINNCLNNSASFTYKHAPLAERSRLFITLALTSIFAFEYITVGFISSSYDANYELMGNIGFAGFIIIFFSTNLSSFDLIKGYWRSVRFKEQEKRGYGSRNKRAGIVSWYFVNAVRSHNYVGQKVMVYNDPYNKNLVDILDRKYEGQIFNRIVLYEDDLPDPNWFLVKMNSPLPFTTDRPDFILVKLRFQEDSLFEQDEVQVFFKSIVDAQLLRNPKPKKDDFPFYGWAYIMLAWPGHEPEVSQGLLT